MAKSKKYIYGRTNINRRIYADTQKALDEYIKRINRFKCRYKKVFVLNRFSTYIKIRGAEVAKYALDIQYELVSDQE